MVGSDEVGKAVPDPDNKKIRKRGRTPKLPRTKDVALMSKKKEMGCPDTMTSPQGSLLEITMVRPREPKQSQ